ncbi:hypothetical protein [Actibacterium lipolyticum]|uniref:Uncharacterized protein n=1 Tax=Actibacterium lipolyticum TaxID=1524263 RepID=A0A238KIT0_9RHOB|nr:hypothetical protein [Actibacterium lipolyticum]SMX41982.1 hypothetical protein COL8621_01865 [Actibacterium lipolyticum]
MNGTTGKTRGAEEWLFERFVTASKENDLNLLWVCGGFLIASFIAVSFNLGAIEAVEFSAFAIKSSLTAMWPIRVMLCVACVVAYIAVVYLVLEHQKLQLGLDYLAASKHERAVEIGTFAAWLDENHPRMIRTQTFVIGAFVTFCAAILVIDIATLAFSFLKPR